MIRSAIIGCGTMADAHAEQIQKTPGARIVGVCDREELMSKQMYDRFDVEGFYTDVDDMLEKAKPNVVHITTPPQSHFPLGMRCLDAGCNVYVEKPFTVDVEEAKQLVESASKNDLKVTVGHNLQFSHAAERMRILVAQGYLGGPPLHMESFYGYDFGDVRYASALLGDKDHWVRSLPGKLIHNIINHGVCKIAEFIENPNPTVIAHGNPSPLMKSIDETSIIDELRVIIHDNDNRSAYFTFSSQVAPKRRYFRIHGPQNALLVDDDHQTVIKFPGRKYKSYLDQFLPPWVFAKQYAGESLGNVKKFLRNDFHMSYGLKRLIRLFYQSIENKGPVPIPYHEIVLTTHIMDRIFQQVYSSKGEQ